MAPSHSCGHPAQAPPTFFITPAMRHLIAPAVVILATTLQAPASAQDKKSKLQFQYESGEIRVPIPTADEPKFANFDQESIRAAARYMDDGALSWTREKKCIACHTTGAYLVDRPMLTKQLGKPNDEVLAEFIRTIPTDVPKTAEENGITFHPQIDQTVWRTAALVQWDKHVNEKLSDTTDKSLRNLLLQQSSHGGFYSRGQVEIPYVTTDFELTLHAVRALVDAPGWLPSLTDPDLLARVDKLKDFLRNSKPRNDYERVLLIELASLMPELVGKEALDASIALLWSKQKQDGGWSTRNFSDTRNWRTPMHESSVKVIESLPDAADPESDPYMTGLAVVLLRRSGVPAEDERLRKAVAWLKSEQRQSGRWWMHSLYRGNYHFTTYIATTKAMQALGMCGELESISAE
jgi:squalene-hopene/tetraprenyl-beta-curcumene cyclase